MTRDAARGRMEGHGFYTHHSEAQRGYVELGLEWLEEAVAEITRPPGDAPFVIADLGAAGGGNSLEPMRRALAARPAGTSALVAHTDIPTNDFSAMFQLIETAPETYLGDPDVFAAAVGRSFYERLFPDRFVSLGWSSIAVHWLSEVPVTIPDHIYSSFARGSVRDAFRAQSARDWLAFLENRAHELRSTGRLIVLGGASRDDGSSGAEGLMDAANGALRELVDSGSLTSPEYARMTIPTWNRTLADFAEPFHSADLDGVMTLRRHELRWLPDPYLARYHEDHDLGTYVEAVADFFRAAFEESLWIALNPSRSENDRHEVIDAFRRGLRTRIAADPERAASEWHVVLLDVART